MIMANLMRPSYLASICYRQWSSVQLYRTNAIRSSLVAPSLVLQRSIHSSLHNYCNNWDANNQKPKHMLMSIQNPFMWLLTKIDFFMLKRSWDPSFNEDEFRAGVKQAVCTVTQLIAENKLGQLEGLMTKTAKEDTCRDIETNWTDEQRRNIALEDSDIQAAVPRRVYFKREKNTRICDVDVSFLALKPDPHADHSLIFIEVTTRFHREYSEFSLAEWTMSVFKIPRFKIFKTTRD
ncbi:hypothetical protein B566_EDAN014387 [Ephemera danica]|nr:hypothetical protein B566_EDAN014387 [Ephemera danica]